MEVKELVGVFVSAFSDDIMGLAFIKILTFTHVEVVKVPSRLVDSKFYHYFTPYKLLSIEVVKTRKHWIVRDVSVIQTIVSDPSFDMIIRHTQMLKSLSERIIEGQEIDVLDWFLSEIKGQKRGISTEEFDKELEYKLSFKTT